MSTPSPSDWIVRRSDRGGFHMFLRVPSVGKAWNAVRVPPRAQCFPCSGACEPLNVYKSPFMGPCGGPFLLIADALAAPSLGLDSSVAAYFFMTGSAGNCMTCCESSSSPHGHTCHSRNSWESLVMSSMMFLSIR
jgi:hypothetical protein